MPAYCFLICDPLLDPLLYFFPVAAFCPTTHRILVCRRGFAASMGKSMRLCGGGSVACFVQTHLLCFCSLNCFFPRCVCVCVHFCSLHCPSYSSALLLQLPLFLSSVWICLCILHCSNHSSVLLELAFFVFPRYRSAFAACIVQATFLHFCCSLHCFTQASHWTGL